LIAPKVVDYQCKLVESLEQLLGNDVARLRFVKSVVFFSFPFISSPRCFPHGGNLLRGLPSKLSYEDSAGISIAVTAGTALSSKYIRSLSSQAMLRLL